MPEAQARGAASVASQLLEFLDEPARLRPRYLHGLETMLPGSLVFKFAQGRIAPGTLADSGRGSAARLQEAALAFIRQVCFWDGATHYQTLGLGADASPDAIKESYRLLMALIHPDRQDANAHPWPEAHAQRVNRAYAVLGDPRARREYDAAMRLLDAGARFAPDTVSKASPQSARERRSRGRAGVRIAKALLMVTAVIATLVLVEAWVSESSGDYSTFQGAFTGPRNRAASVRAEAPRFLGAWMAPETPPATPDAAEALAPAGQAAPPRREVVYEAAPPRAAPAGSEPEPPVAAPAAPRNAELKRSETVTLAQAPVAPPAPIAVVQKAGGDAPGTEAIEVMVARLVGYYEAGDTDRLMALIDTGEAGYWQSLRTRQAYADFFRATKQRRLRLNHLAWHTANSAARAKGEATVIAEYYDAPGVLERLVAVEMDIALRGGEPRITHLTLFPGTP
jgi:DnaJ-domain-containing protein 1